MAHRTLIIAPHIDDELIGCFSLFRRNPKQVTVFYTSEEAHQPGERWNEAMQWFRSTEGPGAIYLHSPPDRSPHNLASGYDEIYVPSRDDPHPDHRAAHLGYIDIATHFYSTSMGPGCRLLTPEEQRKKRRMLDLYFPSQSRLWRNDARYYLFEHLTSECYTENRTLTVGVRTAVVPTAFYQLALQAMQEHEHDGDNTLMRALIRVCKGRPLRLINLDKLTEYTT